MKFLEKDLEQIIYEQFKSQEGCEALWVRGLVRLKPDKVFSQLRLGNYGISDIISYYKPTVESTDGNSVIQTSHRIEVFELKKDKVSLSAFIQGIRYCKAVQRFFSKKGYDVQISLTLIGSEIDLGSDVIYLPDIINSEDFILSLYTYNFDVNGISFKQHEGYCLTNEGFGYEN